MNQNPIETTNQGFSSDFDSDSDSGSGSDSDSDSNSDSDFDFDSGEFKHSEPTEGVIRTYLASLKAKLSVEIPGGQLPNFISRDNSGFVHHSHFLPCVMLRSLLMEFIQNLYTTLRSLSGFLLCFQISHCFVRSLTVSKHIRNSVSRGLMIILFMARYFT